MMGTDLIRGTGDLPAWEQGDVEQQIAEFIALGDKERLAEGRAQAEAYAAYELRAGAKKRAGYFARIKVMAEAGIGVIDLRDVPFHSSFKNGSGGGKSLGSLRIGEAEITATQRGIWRTFGVAMSRNLLDDAMRKVEDADEDVGTYTVWKAVMAIGAGYVPRADLIRRVDATGVSRMDAAKRVATETGIGRQGVYSALSHQKNSPRIAYSNAERIARVVGIDPLELPLAPPKKHLRRKGRNSRLRRDRRLKGGRWDRAYTLHRKTMQEVFEITGEGAHAGLWRNLHAAEDFLRRRV